MTDIISNVSPEFLKLKKYKYDTNVHITNIKIEILTLENELKEQQNLENEINKKIFKICNHKWQRNWNTSHDDICKHICDICGLGWCDK
jgi:hypothetical protein